MAAGDGCGKCDNESRGEPDPAYQEDLRQAAQAYAQGAKDFLDTLSEAARRAGSDFMSGLKR